MPGRLKHFQDEEETFYVDKWLSLSAILLVLYGLLMITSASMLVSEKQYHFAYHFLVHQLIFLFLGIVALVGICNLSMKKVQQWSPILLVIGLVLLLLVLIPGLGRVVNGSRRWLHLGFLTLQASEFMKLFFIIYLASYLERFQEQVQTRWMGFIKPFILLLVMVALLLGEPDFGTSVVLVVTSFIMLFIARARLSIFIMLTVVMIGGLVLIAVVSPYRLARITSFLHPWQHQFGSGYQLTQSLIAFGRGGWFGVGLGNSVQKLFYLPEAHTDFLFAVLGEELGLLGELLLLALFVVFIARCFYLSQLAKKVHSLFASYVAFGLGALVAIQAFINIGVNIGLLPTKGLTLPLMSYGGSSLLVTCMMLGVLLRLANELHHMEYSTQHRFR
jgi:cell division protein FtsW